MTADETYSSPQASSFKGKNCVSPLETVMDVVGGKWKLLLIYSLKEGPVRSATLQHSLVGISNKMFTQSVRELEKDGLVKREIFPVVPPKVEYSLTELGKGLIPAVEGLAQWGRCLCDHKKASTAAHTSDSSLNTAKQESQFLAEANYDNQKRSLEAAATDSMTDPVPDAQIASADAYEASLEQKNSSDEDEQKRKKDEFKALVEDNYDLV